jgi:hypothetical protein
LLIAVAVAVAVRKFAHFSRYFLLVYGNFCDAAAIQQPFNHFR